MNLVEKAKTLIDKVSDQTQSPDVKKVLQDTKNSLESLKKSVDEKNITQPNQESSMNYLKDCIAKIADVQGLSAEEKKIMNDLKIQIEAKSTLETIKIIDIITIVSALEQKSEQLSAVDQEKIKELHQINGLHKTMLDNLKGAIVKTQDKLQEKKIEYITKVKEDLEKHRRSSRLAKPAYEYLMDKHVHKKPIGKFREWLMGSVGIALVGWFVGKDLKDMISNIETIKLDDITDIEKKAEEKLAQANKWYEDVITSIGPIVKGSIEKFSGKKLDESKFKPVFDKRTKDWMMETNIMGDKLEENIKKIRSKQGEVDIFGYTIAFLGLPARAGFDLMIQLACAGVIPRTDIMINTAEQTGKGILKFGLGSIGLFANTIKRTFGNISTEELAEYAKTHISNLDVSNKIAIRGVLYRHGGWFWNIAGKIGTLTGEGLSLLFTERTGGDVGKLTAYRKGGVLQNVETQLQVLKQVEENIIGGAGKTGIYSDRKGSDILTEILETTKKNISVVDITSHANSLEELETMLKDKGLRDNIKSELKDDTGKRKRDLKDTKSIIGVNVKSSIEKIAGKAEQDIGRIERFMGTHFKVSRSKYSGKVELLEKMKDFSKIQARMLEGGEFFHNTRNLLSRRFTVGNELANWVGYSDRMKFGLNSVSEAKDFFDNVRYIGRSSPEMLKVLFKGFPLIMVGKGVLDEMAANPNDSKVMAVLKGIGYVTPFVGPLMLVWEGIKIKDGKFNDMTGASIGLGLIGYDGYSFVKAGRLGGKEVGKFLISPLRDGVEFMRAMGEGAYGFVKMTGDGFKVLSKEGGVLSFGAEMLKFLRGTGLRLGLAAAVLGGLGYRGYKEFFDSATKEEQEELAKIQGKSNEEIEKMTQDEWGKMNDNQKSALIKVATAQKLQIANLENITVEKKGSTINIKLKTLVSKTALGQVQFEIQESVTRMEGGNKKTTVQYSFDGGEIKYELMGKQKEYFSDAKGDLDKDAVVQYLLGLGYDTNEVNEMIATIV